VPAARAAAGAAQRADLLHGHGAGVERVHYLARHGSRSGLPWRRGAELMEPRALSRGAIDARDAARAAGAAVRAPADRRRTSSTLLSLRSSVELSQPRSSVRPVDAIPAAALVRSPRPPDQGFSIVLCCAYRHAASPLPASCAHDCSNATRPNGLALIDMGRGSPRRCCMSAQGRRHAPARARLRARARQAASGLATQAGGHARLPTPQPPDPSRQAASSHRRLHCSRTRCSTPTSRGRQVGPYGRGDVCKLNQWRFQPRAR
jgi:hypothetical protein